MDLIKLEDIDYNIICTTKEEVEECFKTLKKLGFKTEISNDEEDLIISFYKTENSFCNGSYIRLFKKSIGFLNFKELVNKLLKETFCDFKYDENGRLIKILNPNSELYLYILYVEDRKNTFKSFRPCDYSEEFFNMYAELGFCFVSKIALNNYIRYLNIHTKLKNLAYRLNGNKKIDWNCKNCKLYLFYDYENNTIHSDITYPTKVQGVIYCSDFNFKNEAIKEIGEDELKWYLQQNY